MQRLTAKTLGDFLQSDLPTVLLVGAGEGRPTMAQAVVFALLWADCGAVARFAYVDAAECAAASRQLRIRSLPTTLVFRDGVESARLEGVHARASVEEALFGSPVKHAVAA